MRGVVVATLVTVSLGSVVGASLPPDYVEPPVGQPDPMMSQESLIAMQFTEDPYENQDKLELILSGQFTLVEVQLKKGVAYGDFCALDFSHQASSKVHTPYMASLVGQSDSCLEHVVQLPLHELAEACRERDDQEGWTPLEPSAFLFHQPKSGSTLLTNMISAAVPSARIVSEPGTLSKLLACQTCDAATVQEALEDAVYMMGRTTSEAQEPYYLKFDSRATAAGLPLVVDTFPETPWFFVTRHADEVLHKLVQDNHQRRNCGLKQQRSPGALLKDFVEVDQGKSLQELREEQICAATLALNEQVVQQELALSDLGRVVDYDADILNDAGLKYLLETHFGLEVESWETVLAQRDIHAGRGHEWKPEVWDEAVTETVRAANAEFAAY